MKKRIVTNLVCLLPLLFACESKTKPFKKEYVEASISEGNNRVKALFGLSGLSYTTNYQDFDSVYPFKIGGKDINSIYIYREMSGGSDGLIKREYYIDFVGKIYCWRNINTQDFSIIQNGRGWTNYYLVLNEENATVVKNASCSVDVTQFDLFHKKFSQYYFNTLCGFASSTDVSFPGVEDSFAENKYKVYINKNDSYSILNKGFSPADYSQYTLDSENAPIIETSIANGLLEYEMRYCCAYAKTEYSYNETHAIPQYNTLAYEEVESIEYYFPF